MTGAEHGEFAVTVKFDEKRYKYVLSLDYKAGTAEISTITSAVGGRESGRHLPESIRGIFPRNLSAGLSLMVSKLKKPLIALPMKLMKQSNTCIA